MDVAIVLSKRWFKVLRPSDPNYKTILNGYLMFSVKNIVQCQTNKSYGATIWYHYILSSLKANFSDFSHRAQC